LYSDENWQHYYESLLYEMWPKMYEATNIHDKSKAFMDQLICHFNNAFPMKKILFKGNRANKVNLSEHTKLCQMELRELGEQKSATVNEEQKAELAKRFYSLKRYVGFCIDVVV
jgi:hypothetical protein